MLREILVVGIVSFSLTAVRFQGTKCEENIDYYTDSLCQNGGTDIDAVNTSRCKCPPSYTGEFCENDVDECAMRPVVCQNGATCTNTYGSYSCMCVNGWNGSDCSQNIDDCEDAACFNGATCIDGVGSFYCRCTPGKTGLLCHLDDACISNPCHADAICDTSPINGSFVCSCAAGYKGIDCSEDIDECNQESPCEQNGICVNTPGSFECNCSQGFTGSRCETNVNECESHPCQNDGSCLDDPGTFRYFCIPAVTATFSSNDLPEGFNATALPTADDAKKLFKEKCRNGDEAFQNVEAAAEVFRDCLTDLIDFEVLQKEIDHAKPYGDLDVVFNKYCRKRTIAIECMNVFSVAVEPCLDEKEIASKTTFVKIITNLLNFVCHKDGDQIALFIAEKGLECFNDKKDALITCINATMSGYIPSETPTVDNLPQFVMGVQQCNDMNTLQHCIVKELESCDESTPANLVESMFKFVRNETPCANMTQQFPPVTDIAIDKVESQLPTPEDVIKQFKEKCRNVSNGDEAFQNVEAAAEVFRDCLTGLVDFETLQSEIDKAQPNGDLDVVFNKYCRKRNIAIECMNVFSVAVEPCLYIDEIASKTNFVKIITALLNFVCHKDGDQMALFIAEKGPECFNDKKDALITCINATLLSYIPSETLSVDNFPQLIMGLQQCNDMNTLQHCIVKELESCEESTPANLVEAMFQFVRNETPCATLSRPKVYIDTDQMPEPVTMPPMENDRSSGTITKSDAEKVLDKYETDETKLLSDKQLQRLVLLQQVKVLSMQQQYFERLDG